MKTLGEIISLRQNKYNERKNRTFSDFFQGYFEGWYSAYRDLKEILEQNGFNLDVPVIDVVKTNADHIRSMTDEELARDIMRLNFCPPNIDEYKECGAKADCHQCWLDWLKQPYKEDT